MYRSIIIIAFCLICPWLIGQTSLESANRPKVGLALSGGAAHGLAHIGVLKYMEELGIELDYITGTSMGSVIGGLYAMGFDAKDIAHIAGQLDWGTIMSNKIPLTEVAPIEKRFHGKIPISALWKNSSFRLPQGFIRGQKLDLVISKVYCPAHTIVDFDDFHIPFRCVAVNIEDGSIDVLNSGYLGNSIRASMAIPTVFPPKELNGNLYVDGGLLRNFPVQEVVDMGADFVIGVYVGSDKATREELHSMFDILRQSTAMANLLDSEKQKERTHILVEPEVKDIGSFAFDDYRKLIDAGYAAAKQHKEMFQSLADKIKQYDSPKRQPKLAFPSALRFKEVRTTAQHPIYQKLIAAEMKGWTDYAVSLEEVESTLSLVYGTKNFSKASYSFYQVDDGLGLEVDVQEVDPFTIGLNINRFNLYNSSFIISGEARNVIGKPSSFRMDARISDYPGISGHYFLRMPKVPTLIAKASAKIEKYQLPLFFDSVLNRTYAYEQGYVRAELINEWRNKYLFAVGFQFLHDELKPETQKLFDITEYEAERNQVFGQLSYNDLDRHSYPTKGKALSLELAYNFNNLIRSMDSDTIPFLAFKNDKSYGSFYLSYDHYHSLNEQFCFHAGLKAAYLTGRSFLDHYKVGGPAQEKNATYGFVGLDDSELLIGQHISAKAELRMQLVEGLFLSPIIQALHGENYTSDIFGTDETLSIYGIGLGLGYDSPIGPVNFSIGYSDWSDKVVLNLGIGYRHIL